MYRVSWEVFAHWLQIVGPSGVWGVRHSGSRSRSRLAGTMDRDPDPDLGPIWIWVIQIWAHSIQIFARFFTFFFGFYGSSGLPGHQIPDLCNELRHLMKLKSDSRFVISLPRTGPTGTFIWRWRLWQPAYALFLHLSLSLTINWDQHKYIFKISLIYRNL